MLFIESIKSELDKITWGQVISWVSYVGIPFLGWLFSKAVQAMPEPSTSDSKFYIWLYRIGQEIGANNIQANNAKNVIQQKNFINEMDKQDAIKKTNQTDNKPS